MVTVFAFVTLNEANPRALAEFLRMTAPVMQRAGARVVKRFSILEPVLGRPPYSTVIVIEYPDRAALDMVLSSEDYVRAMPTRDIAFSRYSLTIVDDPADVSRQGAVPGKIT